MSLYLAGQVETRELPKEFKLLLDCYGKTVPGIYTKAGYAVKLLVEKYGDDKLRQFLNSLSGQKLSPSFVAVNFKKTYNFELELGDPRLFYIKRGDV